MHAKDQIREDLLDDVYCSQDASIALPKYRFPAAETAPGAAFQVVKDELMLDGNARQNLATFCQTWLDDNIHKLMDLSIDKNAIDKDEYPQTAELEQRCVHMLADLWNVEQLAACADCQRERIHRLQQMNLGQSILPPVSCPACG